MNPIFRILGIAHIVKNFEKNVNLLGWHKANKQFISELGIGVRSNSNYPLNGKGLLIYANHPTGLDPYLISSVINRDDVYILADVYQATKGKTIGLHIIPVYYSSWKEVLSRSGIAFFGYIMMRLISGIVTRIEARKRNMEALDTVIRYLREGKCVILFPSGGAKKNFRWRNGIGMIIHKIRKENINCDIYKYLISDLSENLLLWHIVSRRTFLLRRPVRINGVKISNKILKKLSPSEITTFLQQDLYR